MKQNKLIKLSLESRAIELRESGNSLDDIAAVLSSEVQQKVTKSDVFRYFKGNEKIAIQVIEKQDKLKVAVAEVEISTIEQRQHVIAGLLLLAQNAEKEHVRVLAFREANNALDSLDKRLGKLSGSPGTQDVQTVININQNNLTIKDKIQRYRDAGLFNAQ